MHQFNTNSVNGMSEPSKDSRRFGLRTLFIATTCVAVFVVMARWVRDDRLKIGSLEWLLYSAPSHAFIGFAFTLGPLLFLGGLITSLTMTFRSQPRAWGAWYFLATVLLLLPVWSTSMESFLRWTVATGLVSIAFFLEAVARKLPEAQKMAAVAAMATAPCAYGIALSAISSADC